MADAWEAAAIRNDRERTDNARRAAEALFKPKETPRAPAPPRPEPAAPTSSGDTAAPRRPRILSAQPATPAPKPADPAVDSAPDRPRPRRIPEAQAEHVRTLARYGMTRTQLAEHHDVPVEEIDRILGRTPPR